MVDSVNKKEIKTQLPPLKVGVLPAPKKSPQPKLFDHKAASKKFAKLENDIYQSKKEHSFEKKLSTPILVYIVALVSVGALALHKIGAFKKLSELIKSTKTH